MASDRNRGESVGSSTDNPDSSPPDVLLNRLGLIDHNRCESVREPDPELSAAPSATAALTAVPDVLPAAPAGGPSPTPCSSCSDASVSAPEAQTTRVAAAPNVPLAASLMCSLPPLSQSSLNVPALPPSYLDVSLQEVDSVEEVRNDAANKTSTWFMQTHFLLPTVPSHHFICVTTSFRSWGH